MLKKLITSALLLGLLHLTGQASDIAKDIPLKEIVCLPTTHEIKQTNQVQNLVELLIHQQNQCACLEGTCGFCMNCIGTISGISLTVGSAFFAALEPSLLSYTFLAGSVLLTTGSFCGWFIYGTQFIKSHLNQRALKDYLKTIK